MALRSKREGQHGIRIKSASWAATAAALSGGGRYRYHNIGPACGSLFEQGGELADLRLNGIQLVLNLAAPCQSNTALGIDVDNGGVIPLADRAHGHVNGEGGLPASAFCEMMARVFMKTPLYDHMSGYMVIYLTMYRIASTLFTGLRRYCKGKLKRKDNITIYLSIWLCFNSPQEPRPGVSPGGAFRVSIFARQQDRVVEHN